MPFVFLAVGGLLGYFVSRQTASGTRNTDSADYWMTVAVNEWGGLSKAAQDSIAKTVTEYGLVNASNAAQAISFFNSVGRVTESQYLASLLA